jgi:hypothetical protein
MDRLIELANEAAKLKDDLNIISVEVNAMGMSIHLMDYVFDKYKAIYGWETETKRHDGHRYDLEEFVVVDGVRVFVLRETAKEAV